MVRRLSAQAASAGAAISAAIALGVVTLLALTYVSYNPHSNTLMPAWILPTLPTRLLGDGALYIAELKGRRLE